MSISWFKIAKNKWDAWEMNVMLRLLFKKQRHEIIGFEIMFQLYVTVIYKDVIV